MSFKENMNNLEKEINRANDNAYSARKKAYNYKKNDRDDISYSARLCEKELDVAKSVIKGADSDLSSIQKNYNNEVVKQISEINELRKKLNNSKELLDSKKYELSRYDIRKIEDHLNSAEKNAYKGSLDANKSYSQAAYSNDLKYAEEYLDNACYYSKKVESDLDDAKKELNNLSYNIKNNFLKLEKEKLNIKKDNIVINKKDDNEVKYVTGIKRR